MWYLMLMRCPKCGSTLEVDLKERLMKCEYCSSQLLVDKSGLMFYYIIPFKINRDTALSIFRRWASSPKVAKDLLANGKITGIRNFYFPVYLFKRMVNGKEKYIVEPARGTTLPGLRNLHIPPGSFVLFDSNFVPDAEVVQPDIAISYYLPKLEGKPIAQYLVFFPLWQIEYTYGNNKYVLLIDGSSGKVYEADYPARKSHPYVFVALLGFILSSIAGALGILGIASIIGVGVLALIAFVVTFMMGLTLTKKGW